MKRINRQTGLPSTSKCVQLIANLSAGTTEVQSKPRNHKFSMAHRIIVQIKNGQKAQAPRGNKSSEENKGRKARCHLAYHDCRLLRASTHMVQRTNTASSSRHALPTAASRLGPQQKGKKQKKEAMPLIDWNIASCTFEGRACGQMFQFTKTGSHAGKQTNKQTAHNHTWGIHSLQLLKKFFR